MEQYSIINKLFRTNNLPDCSVLLALILLLITSGTVQAQDIKRRSPNIKLVLQITVDGLRADLLNRYGKSFGKGGFRYLMQKGVVYENAHYQHANTETIVGHTTLATGTFPSVHGMIGNVWFDREAGELSYNIEDPKYPIIPTRETTIKGEQLDPAQKLSRTQGRSPSVILAPTFSDGLAAYYGGRSKIFGVSGKDRSAVSMAGKTGKAFWFSVDNGDFVTSTYYYDGYPDWVHKWNSQRKADKYSGGSWKLLEDSSTYLLGAQDNRPYETDLSGFGRVFPHRFAESGNKIFYTQILVSPVGDKLLLDFTKELVENEELGKDSIPDYLSVSFSSVDAVNHFFGPSSLENEDVVRQLDRILAELLDFIDKIVGLENTLIVLSADHGMADMPEYMSELGFDAGRLDPDKIVSIANKSGKQFGIDEIIRFFYRPYLYLDEKKIKSVKADRSEVVLAIAKELSNSEGIALAVPSSNIFDFNTNPLLQYVHRNFHVSRSGDIYVIQQPYWFLFEKGPVVGMHGSPWSYDTHVPIIFAGPGIKAGKVQRLVHPVDVAPTMSALLGMSPPGSSQGSLLKEVFQ